MPDPGRGLRSAQRRAAPFLIPKEERRLYTEILARYQRRIGQITPKTRVCPAPPQLEPFTEFCDRCYKTTRRLVDKAFQQQRRRS